MKKIIAVLMVALTLTLCFGGALFVENDVTEVAGAFDLEGKSWDPDDWDYPIMDDKPEPKPIINYELLNS